MTPTEGGIIRPGRAIPTEYQGIMFRSRLEADMAMFLDTLAIMWEYEARSFLLPSGKHFCPDFWCPEYDLSIETRGYEKNEDIIEFGLQICSGASGLPANFMAISLYSSTMFIAHTLPYRSAGFILCSTCNTGWLPLNPDHSHCLCIGGRWLAVYPEIREGHLVVLPVMRPSERLGISEFKAKFSAIVAETVQ